MTVLVRNNLEDDVVRQWAKAHNIFCKTSVIPLPEINISPIKYQNIIMGKQHDPIEVRLFFGPQEHVDVLVKCGEDDGWCCRLRVNDVNKCLKSGFPYIYFHNWHTDEPLMAILFSDDLERISHSESMTEDKSLKKPLGGQKYYALDLRGRNIILLNSIKSEPPTFDSEYYFHIQKLLNEVIKQ